MIKHLIRKDNGSITLEAAMILPFFLFFILFLTMFIRLSVADMALYKSASETAELVVAYAYPVAVTKQGASNYIDKKLKGLEESTDLDITGAIQWISEGLDFFGIDVQGSIENLFNDGVRQIIEPTIQKKFKEATGGWNFFDESSLKVTSVEIPSLVGGSNDYLAINVEYRFNLSIPFVDKDIVLKKTAYERIWNGK
ncbi:hypothetical protein H8S33_11030 [Ornithinibacillus sp. BX22]|uniref:Pilus assembly protein n=2 Tax=Ornithinibacillus TaxID=484508 RepID=A0A923L6B7_9BACI|nr:MULTISPECIES: hypothetical protein [Ornithinibacillus]MBC5637338.1 hypothetical protein [Ornithinibacillus hominis]MBS3680355.1 hypothetical protein [Ornithinibacillus massiliensis]